MTQSSKLPGVGEMLPHGEACRNIDELISWEPGEAATAIWRPDIRRFGQEVDRMQMVEAIAQLSCVAAQETIPDSLKELPRVLFLGIPAAVFPAATIPNKTLEVGTQIVSREKHSFKFEGIVTDGQNRLCSAAITGMSVPRILFDRMIARAQGEPDHKPEILDDIVPGDIDHMPLPFSSQQNQDGGEIQIEPTAQKFAGHFPEGQAIYQGAQQVATLGAIARELRSRAMDEQGFIREYGPYPGTELAAVSDVEFKEIVVPGQILKADIAAVESDDQQNDWYSGRLTKASGKTTCVAMLALPKLNWIPRPT